MTKVKLGSDSPLFSYFLVGGINESDLLRRERDKFWRHAARNHLVGMILEHQLVVVVLQRVIINVGRYPQDLVGVGFNPAHVTRFSVVELGWGEPEALGYLLREKLLLVWMEHAIGHGDMEQTLKDVLQKFTVALQ